MKPSLWNWSCLSLLGSFLLLGGCATQSSSSMAKFNEYRKLMDRQKAAIASQEEAARKLPEMGAAGHEKLGDEYLSRGNLDLAVLQYHHALILDSGQLRVRYKMARLLLEKGVVEEAKREFEEILKASPRHALALEGLGRASYLLQNLGQAEQQFRRALEQDPRLWPARNFLGVIYNRQGRHDAALKEYQAALAQQKNSVLLNNLGLTYLLQGQHENAVQVLMEALNLEPGAPRIANNLGLAFCQLEKYPEALEAFKRAGDEASAYHNLGRVYMIKGKAREAVAAFEKALEIKPEFYLGAYENMKKAKAALPSSTF